jgi:PAS domain S-box-containing protein
MDATDQNPMINDQTTPFRRFAWWPVPLLLAAIVVLWIADPQACYESCAVVLLMNIVFAGLVSLCIASLAGGGFIVNRLPGLLLLGSGALAWGTTSVVACALVNRGANVFITIHNLGMLLSALCYIGGLACWRGRVRRPAVWLVAGYAGTLAAVALLTWAALTGHTPAFFIQGQGGTPLRQAVLVATIAGYAGTAGLMLWRHRRQPSSFLYWYGLGLTLLAVGLAGFTLQAVHGGLLGWTGRCAQGLGGVYLLVAALAVMRETGARRLSLTAIECTWHEDLLPALRHHSLTWWAVRYGLAVATVAAGYGFRVTVEGLVNHALPPYISFFPAIMATALLAGLGPGLLATALSCLMANIWVLNANGIICLASPADRVGLAIFFITGVFMSIIASIYQRVRSKAAAYDRQMALDAGERRMRQALRVSRSFTFDWDPRTDHVERSDSCSSILGLSGDEAVTSTGQIYFRKIHSDDRERFVQMLRNLTPTDADYATEYRFMRADGSEVVLEEVGQAEFDTDGKLAHLFGVTTNITERKQAEEATRQTAIELKTVNAALEESRRAALNLMDDAIKARDHAAWLARFPDENPEPVMRTALDGKVLYSNPACAKQPGWACGTGQMVPAVLRTLIRVAAFSRQGMVADVELDHRHYSVTVALFPEEQYVNLYGRDVTERRCAEQALAQAKQEWERTFDSVPDLISILDLDHRIIRVNRAMAERIGKTPAECVGLLCHECVHDRSSPVETCPHQLTLADGKNHVVEIHDDSFGGDFMVTTSPIRNADGTLVSIVHVARDITAQKRAETLERKAEALAFASRTAMDILQSMGEGVVLLDMDGRIKAVNPAMETMSGIPAGKSLGRPIQELIPEMLRPQDQHLVMEALSFALSGQVPEIPPITLLGRTGKQIHVMPSITFVRDMENQPREVVATLRDITELHDAQETLKETNALLERIFDNTHMSIVCLDREFNFLRVNRAYADVCQCEPAFFTGKNHFTLYPNVENEAIFRQVVKTGNPVSISEKPFEFPDHPELGVTYWDWTLRPLQGDRNHVESLLFCLLDVTTRVQARQALVESERKYRELVENASSIIVRFSPEINITFFNEYAQKFFGYTEAEVLGKNVVGTIVPEVDSEGHDLRTMVRDFSAQPEANGSNENENMCKDGRRVWVHWANKAIRDRDGNVTEFLSVGTDITERKQMQAQAVRYQHRLRELAKRLASVEEQDRWRISRFIHDTIVQNLALAHIRLGALAKPLAGAELTEAMQKIDAIRALLDEAIDQCRMAMSDLTPALLYELGLIPALNGFARNLQEKHGTQVTIEDDGQELSLPPELRGLLFESVRELVMNALKHAGPCEIRVFSSCRDGILTIRVTDNGKGFDPSSEEPAVGSHGGFGTFSIRQRIEGLGGELEIESAPGKGTTATIRLPMES